MGRRIRKARTISLTDGTEERGFVVNETDDQYEVIVGCDGDGFYYLYVNKTTMVDNHGVAMLHILPEDQ